MGLRMKKKGEKTEVKILLEEAKEKTRKAKTVIMELLNEPMKEDQKKKIFELYNIMK